MVNRNSMNNLILNQYCDKISNNNYSVRTENNNDSLKQNFMKTNEIYHYTYYIWLEPIIEYNYLLHFLLFIDLLITMRIIHIILYNEIKIMIQ